MSNGKGSALSIIVLLIGVVGISAGGFAIFQNITIEGTPGTDGTDGSDGIDGINGTGVPLVFGNK